MSPEPTTICTVLFAQLGDGTRLTQELGAGPTRALFDELVDVLGAAVADAGGRLVQRVGDEVLCAFADPRSALRGAIALQESCGRVRGNHEGARALSLCIGFHHGEAQLEADRAAGITVYRAKRITEVAKADQILVAEETLDALSETGTPARYLGQQVLRGQEEATRLHELLWNALDATQVFERPDSVDLRPRELLVEAAGKVHRLRDHESLRLGRGTSCEIQLEATGISRLHATIRGEDGRYFLADSSTNGTYVITSRGGAPRFVRRDEVRLEDGSAIGLGQQPQSGALHTVLVRLEPLRD